MTVHLKPELEAMVQGDVDRGPYGSADEFVERAIQMLGLSTRTPPPQSQLHFIPDFHFDRKPCLRLGLPTGCVNEEGRPCQERPL